MSKILRENALLIATGSSVVVGVVIGVSCRSVNPSQDAILLVGFPGEVFIRMLKMLMLPLIIASIITGVGNLKGASTVKMGMISLLYYLASAVIAVLIALALGLLIRPGEHSHSMSGRQPSYPIKISGLDVFLDFMRNMVPDNIVAAGIQHSRTVAEDNGYSNPVNNDESGNITSYLPLPVIKKIKLFDGANILGVLFYCVVFGIILSKLGRQGKTVTKFFSGINAITRGMIKLVMWYSPVGIACLIASQIMSTEDVVVLAGTMGVFILTELASLAFHCLAALPLLYFILTRGNAYGVYFGSMQALFTALGTSSSSATLPITMRCVEKKLKMDQRIAGFVLPIGMIVNVNAGAISAVLGPLFIAQLHRVTLSFPQILLLSTTAPLSSVGSAGVPGSAILVKLMVLTALGLPNSDITILLAFEWLTDRIGAVVNVASDCLAVGVTSRFANLPPQEGIEAHPMSEEVRPMSSLSTALPQPEVEETTVMMNPEEKLTTSQQSGK